jgi:hypothetical protein
LKQHEQVEAQNRWKHKIEKKNNKTNTSCLR